MFVVKHIVSSEASEKSGRSPRPRPADEDEIAILLKLRVHWIDSERPRYLAS